MRRSLAAAGLLVLGLPSLATGCVSNTITLEDDDSATSDSTGSGGTTTPMTTGEVTTLAVTTAVSADEITTNDSQDDGETADEPPGFCAQVCMQPSDCGPAPDFECIDGFCEYVGEPYECDPAMCDDLGIGVCTFLDGFSVCSIPCVEGDGSCEIYDLECTGSDDLGNSICTSTCFGGEEGEPCFIEGFGTLGTCIDGSCTCMSDAECTADGFGCKA